MEASPSAKEVDDRRQKVVNEILDKLWQKETTDSSGSIYTQLFNPVMLNMYASTYKLNRADGKSETAAAEHRQTGNTHFQAKEWSVAMDHYNKSICCADPTSESLALGYGNRSSCFFRMGKYENCLRDIDLAIKANYPERLMEKLVKRRSDCLEKISAQGSVPKSKIELSYLTHQHIPVLANVVEIHQNAEFGRHVVAKCDIPYGKTISLEPSYVAATTHDPKIRHCTTCQRIEQNLQPCANCTLAMFCSDECLERSKAFHLIECGYKFEELSLGPAAVYMIRTISLALNACGTVDQLMDFVEQVRGQEISVPRSISTQKQKYQAFLQLHTRGKEHQTYELAVRSVLAHRCILLIPKLIDQFDTLAKQRFLMHLLVMHDIIINENSFKVSRNAGNRFSTMGVVLPMFNHRCAPNAFNWNVAGKEVTFTIRPIKKGEQIFLSYLPFSHPNPRQYVFEKFGFWCTCDKCVNIELPQDELREMQDDYHVNEIERTLPSLDKHIYRWREVKEHCVKFLDVYGHLPTNPILEYVTSIFIRCMVFEFEQGAIEYQAE